MNGIEISLLATVEGFTEFLPISSTGHLILTSRLLGLTSDEFTKTFEIVIQLGAILSVLFLYWDTIRTKTAVWKTIFVGFVPSAVIGATGYTFIKGYLFEQTSVIVAALAIGGVVLIALEYLLPRKINTVTAIEHISYRKAFVIGLLQSVSVIPGVSRSAATIAGGMVAGLSRRTATEFSFLLAIPTIGAAAGLDLVRSNITFSWDTLGILILGSCISFVTSYISIRFLIQFVRDHSFVPFGIYRIGIAILFAFITL